MPIMVEPSTLLKKVISFVAIWADNNKIFLGIVLWVSISMMNLKNFWFFIPTTLLARIVGIFKKFWSNVSYCLFSDFATVSSTAIKMLSFSCKKILIAFKAISFLRPFSLAYTSTFGTTTELFTTCWNSFKGFIANHTLLDSGCEYKSLPPAHFPTRFVCNSHGGIVCH